MPNDQSEIAESTKASDVATDKTSQFVGFQLAEQNYAFRIEQIQEIVILDQITRIPQVPDYIEGVSNLRGTIIPIINLRQLFGYAPSPAQNESRTIVVNVGQRTMGCMVDAVSQVMRIADTDIQQAPEIVAPDGTGYLLGFAKLDEQLIVLLNVDDLLEPTKLETVRLVAQQGQLHAESDSDRS